MVLVVLLGLTEPRVLRLSACNSLRFEVGHGYTDCYKSASVTIFPA
jgi:hypothetical protein